MSGMELLLAATTAASAAGAAIETIGAVLQAEEDGKIARANAGTVQAEASEAARLESAEGRRITAQATVRAAASGMSVDGSSLDVIGELAAEGELRSRSAIHKGRVQYDNFRAEQANAKRRKTVAVGVGAMKIGSTILTAGGGFSPGGAAAGGGSGVGGMAGSVGSGIGKAGAKVGGGL